MTAPRPMTAPLTDDERRELARILAEPDLADAPRPEPQTEASMDALWEALVADIHSGGYSVRDAIQLRHRAAIEAQARAPLAARMREAVADGSALDAAWKAVEAAAEEGWQPAVEPWLDDRLGPWRRDDWRWIATLHRVELIKGARRHPDWQYLERKIWPGEGYGPTPAAALTALADALRRPGSET